MSQSDLDEAKRAMAEADVLATPAEVTAALDRMAAAITGRLADANPICYCVMNGGLVIAGRLLSRLNFPLEVAYLHATRYGHALNGALLDWRVRPTQDLKGRTVLIIDDILDEGHTLEAINAHCRNEGAKGAILGYGAAALARRSVPALAALALGGWAFNKWRERRRSHPSYPSEATPSS